MRFTVEDCMKLPSLREAKLLAGSGGLEKAVISVSVLEHANVSTLSENLMYANEIIISAFVTVKDDVDEQMAVVKHLCAAGVSGLILYYVGIFLPQVDERLLQLADELNFPIISMPENRYEARYSEAIGEIYEAILKTKLQHTNFVNFMLERIAQMEEHKRTYDTVLRMLSDHLSCSLLLADYTFNLLALAAYPSTAVWDSQEIVRHYKEMRNTDKGWELLFLQDGSAASVCCMQVAFDRDSWANLIVVCAPGKIHPTLDLMQAVELLRLFITIWKNDIGHDGLNILIQAIIEDEPMKLQRMLQKLRLDISAIRIMWVVRLNFGNMSPEQAHSSKSQILLKTEAFLKNRHKPVIIGIYEGNIVIMMAPYSFPELDTGLAEEYFKELSETAPSSTITVTLFTDRNTVDHLREAYLLFKSYYASMRKIYPSKSVYTLQELHFAKTCRQLSTQGKSIVSECCEAVKLLREFGDGESLVETLTVFLLDTQSNMQKTGEQLFVHKNTIKYRLKKIQQHLGYSIFEMPASLHLYTALGLDRLLATALEEKEKLDAQGYTAEE